MISFKPFDGDSYDECLSYAAKSLPNAEKCEIADIFESLSEMAEECEVGISAYSGCLLVRIYDGEYIFAYPIPMTEDADEDCALDEMRLYAIKEEIPFVLTDVPGECAEVIEEKYENVEILCEDEDEERYRARFISECAKIPEDMSFSFENGLNFVLPTDIYASEYARLCRDEGVNRFWGYDFRCDAEGCDDGYFLREAERGFNSGCTLTLFVLQGDKFVGEALLYYFNYLGGAECAVRLLPEFMGRGLGTEVLWALIKAASDMGLKELYATVDPENLPSIKLFEKKFEKQKTDGKNLKFLLKM